jgi:MFS family permease
VALALAIIVLLSSGIRFTIGPFLKPVTTDLGLDRGSFSLVVAASLLLYGAFMPLVGRLVDRVGARVVCAGGAFVMAASLVLTGRMSTLWEFYLYYAVIGSLGLAATGHVMVPPAAGIASVERTAIADALRVPSFWLLTAGLFNCGFSMSLLSAHGVPMLTDHGFHPMTASSAIGSLGMTAIGGGLTLGLISDRWGRKPMLAAVYVLRVAAFGMLFAVQDPRLLLLVAAIGGVGMSGSLAMTSALTGDLFGRYSVGSLFGLIFLSHQAGAALGSWLGGALFDLTGGYGAAFAVAAALLPIAAGLSLAINERARPASRAVPLPGRPHPVAGGR